MMSRERFGRKFWPALAIIGLGIQSLLFAAPPASALPSFARQTGQQCAACHNGFPELTPYGRLFKLNGYIFGGGTSDYPPFAMMITGDFTHTQAGQAGGAARHYGPNDNIAVPDSASIFYGGAIAPSLGLGAFAQATYSQTGRTFSWDNTDIRWAKSTALGGETVFGVSLNNNPTMTDLWNTTPAWRYPFLSSGLAPTPAAATIIEGTYAQQVLGLSGYAFWNRLVYAEIGGYKTLTKGMDQALGAGIGSDSFKGLAPYWRLALQPQWGRNSLEVGIFGMAAAINPGRVTGFGTNHKTDFGIDAQYQFLTDRHSVSAQASWITENQGLSSSFAQGLSTNTRNHLRSLNVKASYYYNQTYGGTLAHFQTNGTSDALLYSSSANGSPNSTGYIAELDYMPFNYGGPDFWPWLNMKIGLQYVWYTKFNGAATNYDGNGRNASDNNTLFLYTWITF